MHPVPYFFVCVLDQKKKELCIFSYIKCEESNHIKVHTYALKDLQMPNSILHNMARKVLQQAASTPSHRVLWYPAMKPRCVNESAEGSAEITGA